MASVVTVTLSNGEVRLHLNNTSVRIYTCNTFREWFAREFGDRAPLASVWSAIRVPGWLLFSATDSRFFGDTCRALAQAIDDSFGDLNWASAVERSDDCDDIREALPAELLEAFFAETLASPSASGYTHALGRRRHGYRARSAV
jgi:hypothetical protein